MLAEQKLKVPMPLASRQYVIENGQIIWSGATEQIRQNQRAVETLIGF